jgi:hypothetical protein
MRHRKIAFAFITMEPPRLPSSHSNPRPKRQPASLLPRSDKPSVQRGNNGESRLAEHQ